VGGSKPERDNRPRVLGVVFEHPRVILAAKQQRKTLLRLNSVGQRMDSVDSIDSGKWVFLLTARLYDRV
jgi:hypothetical protein